MADFLADLRAEIALPAYVGMDDDQIAAAINENMVSVTRGISRKDARQILMENAAWPTLRMVADGRLTTLEGQDIPVAVIGACITISDLLMAPDVTVIEVTDPAVMAATQAALGGLVAFSIASQAQNDAILALGAQVVSQAQSQFGKSYIGNTDVEAARVS